MPVGLLFEELLTPGAAWSHVMKRGTSLRMVDVDGGANVCAVLYNFDCLAERLNIPDTLKAQHTARLARGNVLYSDMGRILCSITDDTIGWHDPFCGYSTAEGMARKYGVSTYQESRNAFHRNSRDSLSVELAKYGLGRRDLTACINFFSKVTANSDGSLTYQPGHSPAGSFVELRAEMNSLVLLTSAPHPLDPSPVFSPRPVKLVLLESPPPPTDDLCRVFCPENERGFVLTERYFM